MAEGDVAPRRPTDPVGRFLYSVARWMAIAGGIVLFAMTMLTAVSIFGRAAFAAPIPGDFELISIGTGIAMFASLPYCQIVRGNVIVDFFMAGASVRAKAFFDAIGGLLYLFIGALLTWRMVYGAIDMYTYSEKTITINFPRWSTFPISIACMTVLLVVVVYSVGRSIAESRANRFMGQ